MVAFSYPGFMKILSIASLRKMYQNKSLTLEAPFSTCFTRGGCVLPYSQAVVLVPVVFPRVAMKSAVLFHVKKR